MSPGRDNITDLEATRRAKPRLRKVEIRTSDGGSFFYELTWPADKRLRDIDNNLLIPMLLAAGLSFQGQPIAQKTLEGLPFQTLVYLVKGIDSELARQDAPQPPESSGKAFSEATGFLQVDVWLAGQWRSVILRPWGMALREAGDDAVALRQIFADCRLHLNGFELELWRLCEMPDHEILALSLALQQAAMECIRVQGEQQQNGN